MWGKGGVLFATREKRSGSVGETRRKGRKRPTIENQKKGTVANKEVKKKKKKKIRKEKKERRGPGTAKKKGKKKEKKKKKREQEI